MQFRFDMTLAFNQDGTTDQQTLWDTLVVSDIIRQKQSSCTVGSKTFMPLFKAERQLFPSKLKNLQ